MGALNKKPVYQEMHSRESRHALPGLPEVAHRSEEPGGAENALPEVRPHLQGGGTEPVRDRQAEGVSSRFRSSLLTAPPRGPAPW